MMKIMITVHFYLVFRQLQSQIHVSQSDQNGHLGVLQTHVLGKSYHTGVTGVLVGGGGAWGGGACPPNEIKP